jgi:hypothetical protein
MSGKALIDLIILYLNLKGSQIYVKKIYCLIKMDNKRQDNKRKKFLWSKIEGNKSKKQVTKGK